MRAEGCDVILWPCEVDVVMDKDEGMTLEDREATVARLFVPRRAGS